MNSKEFSTFYDDAVAFVDWCMKNGRPASLIVSTLTHDICGIVRKEPCFTPRVRGYAVLQASGVDYETK